MELEEEERKGEGGTGTREEEEFCHFILQFNDSVDHAFYVTD